MAGRSGLRGRRTRVYDCNYDMGESYYRPAIDRLDRKYSGRPETVEAAPPSAAARDLDERYARAFENDDLNSARRRAEKTISEETLFDSRGGRAARGRPLSAAIEDVENDFDDEVTSSLRRLRANKKKSAFLDDVDMESTVANLQSRSRLGMADKILDSVGIGADSEGTRKRIVRMSTTTSTIKDNDSSNMTRWTAMDENQGGGAAARARVSRARLTDLEDETVAMQQRQAVRERRAADLRALLAESDM